MFETLALTLLERVLGEYVEGIDRNSLKVAVWKGHVSLKRLRLKREACYGLGLPVDVRAGYVESAEVQIPWNKLGSEPVTITLDGVYLVCGPLDEASIDVAAADAWRWARKQIRLRELTERGASRQTAAADVAAAAVVAEAGAGGGGGGASLSLLAKIINNLQLSLRNLHARYEDASSSSSPFAAGVTIEELAVFSTDASGARAFSASPEEQFKRGELRGFAVYHHCACDQMLDPHQPLAETAEWLRALVTSTADDHAALRRHYVMQPVRAAVSATLRPGAAALRAGRPRASAEVSFSALALSVSEQQLRDTARLLEFISRPPKLADADADVIADAGADAAAIVVGGAGWARPAWRAAVQRVKRERLRQAGWQLHPGYFEARRESRSRYIELHKRTQQRPWLKPLEKHEEEELRSLEHRRLSAEDIFFFRSLAEAQLQVEDAAHSAAPKPAAAPARQTWYAWLTGAGAEEAEASESLGGGDGGGVGGAPIVLSAEQREALASLLDSGDGAAEAEEVDSAASEYVRYELRVALDQLSLTLVEEREPHFRQAEEAATVGGSPSELAHLSLCTLQLRLALRTAGVLAEGGMQSVEMVDCSAPEGSLGRALIRQAGGGGTAEPQWCFRFVQRPAGRSEDMEIAVSVGSPLELVHNAPLLERVSRFFAVVGETERHEIAQLVREQAEQAFRTWREDTIAGVLARHKTSSLQLQLAAPRLIVPETLADASGSVLVVDMGDIRLSSAVQANAPTTGALSSFTSAKGDDDSVDEPASLYDFYRLEVSSVQLLLAPGGSDWRSPREQVQQRMHLVHQLGLTVQLRRCILPPGTHPFAQLALDGALSESGARSLNMRLSSAQLRSLLAIARAAEHRDALRPPPHSSARAHHAAGAKAHSAAGMEPSAAAARTHPADSTTPAALSIRGVLKLQHIMLMLADDAEKDTVMLRTSNIELRATQRSEERRCSFSLGSLHVEDRTQPHDSHAFRLVRSGVTHNGAAAEPESSETQLVQIDYVSGRGGASDPSQVSLSFSRLHIEWNPTTIAMLLAFVRLPATSAQRTERQPSYPPDLMSESVVITDEQHAIAHADDVMAAETRASAREPVQLLVTARLLELSVSLNEEQTGAALALFAMNELSVEAQLRPEGEMHVNGQLGDLTAQDTYTAASQPYEMLGLRPGESSLLTFQYHLPSEAERASARARRECDSSLLARMSSVRVNYWHPAVMRTVEYLQSGVLGALMSATASTMAQMARSVLVDHVGDASVVSLDVEVGSPLVVLPTRAGATDGFRADLGRLVLHNRVELREGGSDGADALLDCIGVRIEQMKLVSLHAAASAEAAEELEPMLDELALQLSVERGIGSSVVRAMVVSGSGGELLCTCTKQQYDLLMLMAAQNLAGGGDELTVPSMAAADHLDRLETGAQHPALAVQADRNVSPMSVRFHLDLIGVALRTSGVSEGEQSLAQVDMRRFVLEYEQSQQRGREVRVSLDALQLHDELNEGKCLLTSVRDEGAAAGGFDKMASITYSSAADVGAHEPAEVSLKFSHMHVEWNPTTIAMLLAFVRLPATSPRRAERRPAHAAPELMSESVVITDEQHEIAHADDVTTADTRASAREPVQLLVTAQLQELSVSLNEEQTGAALALFAMKELSVEAQLRPEGEMHVSGQLGDLTAQDTYTAASQPYEMLGLRPGESSLLTFQYHLPSEAERASARARRECDSSVRARMSSVRVNYWHPAVMRTVEYLQSGVLGALMSATASTMAQVARSVLVDHVGDASVVSLDVEVGSPLVVLPTRAGATDGFRADLGRLVLHNRVELREGGSDGADALLDCIGVSIEQMKLVSLHAADAEAGEQLEAEPMLDELALQLSVERGIGSSVGRAMVVSGSGGELLCTCTKQQYDLLMLMAAQNLAGAGDPAEHGFNASAVAQAEADALLPEHAPGDLPASHDPTAAASRAGAADEDGSNSQHFQPRVLERRIQFSLGSAKLQLVDEGGPLVCASAQGFTAEYAQFGGRDRDVTLCCSRLSLENSRARISKQGIEKLLWAEAPAEQNSSESGHTPPQLHVLYSESASGPQRTLNLSLFGTKLTLAHGTFLAAAMFFVPPGDAHAAAAERRPHTPRTRRSRPEAPASSSSVTPTTSTPAPTAPPFSIGSMVVLLSMEAVELRLPRDPEAAETDGLALRGAAVVKYSVEADLDRLELELQQLGLLVQQRLGEGTGTTILAPVDASLRLARRQVEPRADSSATTLMEMVLMASTPIECCISFSDCKLALDIIQGLRAVLPAKTPEEPVVPPAPPLAASESASAVTESQRADAFAPQASGGGNNTPAELLAAAAADAGVGASLHLTVSLQVEKARLVAINDFNGRAVPLVALMLSGLSLSCAGSLEQLALQSEVRMDVQLHNPSLAAWEPLLEPWHIMPTGSMQPLASPPYTELSLAAQTPCNLNLSVSMCELLSRTILTLLEDVMGADALVAEAEPFSPFSLKNETGTVVHYGRAGGGAPSVMLVPGEEQRFDFWPEVNRLGLCNEAGPPKHALAVVCTGWSRLDEVPIDRVGRRVLTVHAARAADAPRPLIRAPAVVRHVVCEVSIVSDRKHVRLLSTTMLKNATEVLLCVRLWHPHNASESVHPLQPGESLPMPLRADNGAYRICLRPMDGPLDWSESLNFPGDDGLRIAPATLDLSCRSLDPSLKSWHFVVHHDGRPDGLCEVAIHPPFMLTNLLGAALRYELRGSGGGSVSGTLRSGGSKQAHSFSRSSPVALTAQLEGYAPSERTLVNAPPSDVADDVLAKTVNLFDANNGKLELSVQYERPHKCTHAVSVLAPYWVINHTGLSISLRQEGARHAFSMEEADVVKEVVCENQRRRTLFHDFSAEGLFLTDGVGTFSDERMNRRFFNLSSVWVPTGWMWLDPGWSQQLDANTDVHGWQYAANWNSGWVKEPGPLAYVRRRRWVRRRTRISGSNAAAAAALDDAALEGMSVRRLREMIEAAGLQHADCVERSMLQQRAAAARDTLQRTYDAVAGAASISEHPLMPPVLPGRKLQIKLPGASWSAPVGLDAVGTHGLLELKPREGEGLVKKPWAYQLGLSVQLCPGAFGRSKMLVIDNRVMLINRADRPLGFKQHAARVPGEVLQPGERAPLHWQQPGSARLLSVCALHPGSGVEVLASCDWSNALPIHEVGEVTVVCRLPNERRRLFITVDVQMSGAVMHVSLAETPPQLAPYRIDNLTQGHSLLVSQSPCDELTHPRVIEEVKPQQRLPFAWEQVVREPTLALHAANNHVSLGLDDLQLLGGFKAAQVAGQPSSLLRYRLVTDGPIKVLQVTDAADGEGSSGRGGGGGVLSTSSVAPAAGDDGRLRLKVWIELASVGLSLVDTTPRELLYLSLSGVRLTHHASGHRASSSLAVRTVQIDSCLPDSTFAVLARPYWTQAELKQATPPPAVELLMQQRLGYSGLHYYETISLRLQTLELMFDTLLARTLALFAHSTYTDITRLAAALIAGIGWQLDTRAPPTKVYTRWLNIQPMRLLVSCRAVAGGLGVESFVEVPAGAIGILNSLASLLANVDRAPLQLNALVLDNAFAPPATLLKCIYDFVVEQLLQQVYKLFLSFEVLGNPRGLFSRMATGVSDAFYEPMVGILRGPEEFAQGMLRGSKSLADNVVFGLTDTVSRMSGALGKGLAELSMDKEYLSKRAEAERSSSSVSEFSSKGPKSVGEGLRSSVGEVSSGLLRGVSGVVTKPVKGAKKAGVEGFFKGVAQGAVGLLVQPMVGVADGISSATEGLRNTTEVSQQQAIYARRVRPPRTLGFYGEVLPYSRADADAQQLLQEAVAAGGREVRPLLDGRFYRHCVCGELAHSTDKLLVVSTMHVALLSLRVQPAPGGPSTSKAVVASNPTAGPSSSSNNGGGGRRLASVDWFEPLQSVGATEEFAEEVGLHLRNGGLRFIPCGNPHARKEARRIVNEALRAVA